MGKENSLAPADIRMYTREEVADMIGCHKDNVCLVKLVV